MFLKNKNIISKIRRSKVTDYAALNGLCNHFELSRFKLSRVHPSFFIYIYIYIYIYIDLNN